MLIYDIIYPIKKWVRIDGMATITWMTYGISRYVLFVHEESCPATLLYNDC